MRKAVVAQQQRQHLQRSHLCTAAAAAAAVKLAWTLINYSRTFDEPTTQLQR